MERVSRWDSAVHSAVKPHEMKPLIFHSRPSTLCHASGGLGSLHMCPVSHRSCTHTHTLACTHTHTRLPIACALYKIALCALSPDCPATAAASAAATQNQPPAAANPGEANSSICPSVRPSICPPACSGLSGVCVCVCVFDSF